MSKEEREELFASVSPDELLKLEGVLDTKDKKEKLALRITVLRAILNVVAEYVEKASETKTRNKVLSQISGVRKEIRKTADEIEEYKSKKIKIDAVVSEISDCEKFLTGQDLLSLLGVLDKRYLGAVYNNIKTLEQAVVDGEVEFTNDLAKKIIKKSLDLLIGSQPTVLTKEQADDILISELI